MASHGINKGLMIIILAFVLAFIVLVLIAPSYLDKFINWTLGILGLITAGFVVYILIKINKRK